MSPLEQAIDQNGWRRSHQYKPYWIPCPPVCVLMDEDPVQHIISDRIFGTVMCLSSAPFLRDFLSDSVHPYCRDSSCCLGRLCRRPFDQDCFLSHRWWLYRRRYWHSFHHNPEPCSRVRYRWGSMFRCWPLKRRWNRCSHLLIRWQDFHRLS